MVHMKMLQEAVMRQARKIKRKIILPGVSHKIFGHVEYGGKRFVFLLSHPGDHIQKHHAKKQFYDLAELKKIRNFPGDKPLPPVNFSACDNPSARPSVPCYVGGARNGSNSYFRQPLLRRAPRFVNPERPPQSEHRNSCSSVYSGTCS